MTEKADFGFVEFCNVMEWMLELYKGMEHCSTMLYLLYNC